ncbi:MAG: M28 family peptidase, partial [Owenweeksia sp.]
MEGAEGRVANDIRFLASDNLAGREPGTEGATEAARYIEASLAESGALPPVDGMSEQSFEITTHIAFPAAGNIMIFDKKPLSIPEDYFPMAYSTTSGKVKGETVYVGYGINAPEKEWNDYKDIKSKKLRDKIFVIDLSSPDGIHPHSEYLKYHDLGTRVDLAIEKGAIGVVFVNLEEGASDPRSSYRTLKNRKIPVVFVQNPEVAKDLKKGEDIEIRTLLEESKITASNIMGYVNNGAEKTVVIGAHYDHLGYGGSSSLYRGETEEIHNGADDNASGTAGLLELARNVGSRKKEFSKFNYLFVAFSGEEMGLLGSSYFVKNSPIPTNSMAYMLNMDMIGRLEEGVLAVNGVGTSPIWPDMVRKRECSKLTFKTSESGVGPSDHTSFYYREIPVLHFFTGTHMDYHKPSDDFEKINISGEVEVLQFILNLMYNLEEESLIEYTPTREETTSAPRFTVTLGVLPDYMYSDKGMRIDGVTEGKPAARAGMKAGDIIVQMG